MPTVITLQGADASASSGSYKVVSLGEGNAPGSLGPASPAAAVALSVAMLAAVIGGAWFVTRRRSGGLGGLFLCEGSRAGCDGPYPDNRWEDVLSAAKKQRLHVWRGVRRPDFLVY